MAQEQRPRCGRKAAQSFSIDSILEARCKTSDGESSSSPTSPNSPTSPSSFSPSPFPSVPVVAFPKGNYAIPQATAAHSAGGFMVAVPQAQFLPQAYPIFLSPQYYQTVYRASGGVGPKEVEKAATYRIQPSRARAAVNRMSTSSAASSDTEDSAGEDTLTDGDTEKCSSTEQPCELSLRAKRRDGFRKKKRTAFTTRQLQELENKFAEQKYLTKADRTQLAERLGLTEKHVKTWYQNRRTKWKRGTTETEWSREREHSAAIMYHQFVNDKSRVPAMPHVIPLPVQ